MARILIGNVKHPLVNNGLTTEVGKYALDAAYGKALTDKDKELENAINRLNSDYIIPESNNYARIDKYGHVDLSVIATADYTGKLTTIFTIGEKYRPLSEKMIIGKTTINGNVIPCTFYIRSNGNLDAYAGESIDTSVPFVCCGGYSVK